MASSVSSAPALVSSALDSVGLEAHAVAGPGAVEALARLAQPSEAERYGLPDSSGIAVALLPYDPRPPTEADAARAAGSPPYAVVGAFASANRYAALLRLLQAAAAVAARETGLARRSFRALVNSRLPEKPLAAMAGLGYVGRSGLFVSDAYGPACVIGALLLPPGLEAPEGKGPVARAANAGLEGCGTCSACQAACPSGAIGPGGLDTGRCAQYWASRAGTLPRAVEATWGRRLYGCDFCVAACPASAGAYASQHGPSPAERAEALLLPEERRPGRLVAAGDLAEASDAELRARLRKTALGLSWIAPEALRRNARLAARALAPEQGTAFDARGER